VQCKLSLLRLPFVLFGECHHCCGLFVELALYIKNPTGTLSLYGRMVSLSSCRLGIWLHTEVGLVVGSPHGQLHSSNQHRAGFVGICSVLSNTTFQRGTPRIFCRRTQLMTTKP